MSSSVIKKTSGWASAVETVTFPFTADCDGILSATAVPNNTSASYVYITASDGTTFRFAGNGGLSYQITIPIKKGLTYSIAFSSNYTLNGNVNIYPL